MAKRTLPVYLDYPARTEAIQSVSLQAKVTGYLKERVVADGADVKAGDVLYVIDDRDARTALAEAKAQLERDTAQADYLRSSLKRGEELSQKGFLAKDGFDQRFRFGDVGPEQRAVFVVQLEQSRLQSSLSDDRGADVLLERVIEP